MQAMFAETDAAIAKTKATVNQNKSLGSVAYHELGLKKTQELEKEFDRLANKVLSQSG